MYLVVSENERFFEKSIRILNKRIKANPMFCLKARPNANKTPMIISCRTAFSLYQLRYISVARSAINTFAHIRLGIEMSGYPQLISDKNDANISKYEVIRSFFISKNTTKIMSKQIKRFNNLPASIDVPNIL